MYHKFPVIHHKDGLSPLVPMKLARLDLGSSTGSTSDEMVGMYCGEACPDHAASPIHVIRHNDGLITCHILGECYAYEPRVTGTSGELMGMYNTAERSGGLMYHQFLATRHNDGLVTRLTCHILGTCRGV